MSSEKSISTSLECSGWASSVQDVVDQQNACRNPQRVEDMIYVHMFEKTISSKLCCVTRGKTITSKTEDEVTALM